MKIAFTDGDHYNAVSVWKQRNLVKWLTNVFSAPSVQLGPRCTPNVRKHVETEFLLEGWALNVKLDQSSGISIFAQRNDLAFQLQTGNMSRAPYDLLKFQYLFVNKRIDAAALALPTKRAAKIIGKNIANAERVIAELELFNSVITVPIFVVAFE